MKASLTVLFIFVSVTSYSQNYVQRTTSLLSWLIKTHHITYLDEKSNAGVFYDTTALKKQPMLDNSFKEVPNVCIGDLLSATEVEAFKTIPRMLMQTDWRIKYPGLKVKFVSEKFVIHRETKNLDFTVYNFSGPLFLDKNRTRVLIGETFVCGMACGRMDLLLCEFKEGSWHLLGGPL